MRHVRFLFRKCKKGTTAGMEEAMKKKLFLIILALGMTVSLSARMGNGESGQTNNSGEAVSGTQTETRQGSSKKKNESTRLVSVDKIEKYVTIAEYKGLELENPVQKITGKMVETRIAEILAESSKESLGAKAEIQEGDLVTMNYIGTIDGKSFEGSTVSNYDWVVGEGDLDKSFEEQILGMKRGETRSFSCVFPEDYYRAGLAGKEVDYTVTIQTIRRIPEFDDEWVEENSDVETTEEYEKLVKKELKETAEAQMKKNAWEHVVTNSAMLEYPDEDVENAKTAFQTQMAAMAEAYQMDLEAFVKSQGITMEEYEEQCQIYAERKVKQNLIVQGIIDREDISLDDEESLEIQNQIMKDYEAESLAELIDMYGQVQIDESIALLRVEDFIYENAVIVEPVAASKETEGVSGENKTEG